MLYVVVSDSIEILKAIHVYFVYLIANPAELLIVLALGNVGAGREGQ
jgi:hypothetical protein